MKIRTILISAAAILAMAGCDTNEATSSVPAKGNVNGVVVVPKAADANTSGIRQCADLPIPGGYLPLADANVTYVDENGTEVSSTVTDRCGRFYSNVETAGLTLVKIRKNGYHTMLSDISSFDNGGKGWGIVSTADINNSFAVRVNAEGESLSYQRASGLFKYSVIDTKTGRAVLGIPRDAVKIYVDKNETNVTSYIFNDLDADLVLTLDASGSMESEWTDANGTSIGTGFDVTYHVSKTFIDELSGNSQLGITIFDDKIDFIDRSFINSLNLDGDVPYASDGFERNKVNSKFVIDIYHPHSHVYDVNNTTLIPEYPYTTKQEYRWGGLTAYIDAASKAVEKLNKRPSQRKLSILMTDGGDNSSSKTISDVIREARAAKVTFYTISIGPYTDTKLQSLAESTGGLYIKADGSDLGEKFADILSEIQYFYEVGTDLDKNTTAFIRVDIELDGETVSGLVDYNGSAVNPQPTPPENENAVQLYTKCMPCHGMDGGTSAYGVTAAINTLENDTIRHVLTAYRNGLLDQYGYGDVMHAQVANYSDTQIEMLSQYIPTLKGPDINMTSR